MERPNRKPKSKVLTIPNILSCVRLCLIPLIVWLYCVEQKDVWAGCVLILSGITDVVDGYIARRFDMTSDLGKVLDPLADKTTQGAMIICLLSRFPQMIYPLISLIAKETFMSVTGILVIRKSGDVPGANWHGKAATCLLYAMMVLHVFWPDIPAAASMASIVACSAMIGISFVLYGMRNLQVLKQSEL